MKRPYASGQSRINKEKRDPLGKKKRRKHGNMNKSHEESRPFAANCTMVSDWRDTLNIPIDKSWATGQVQEVTRSDKPDCAGFAVSIFFECPEGQLLHFLSRLLLL